MSQKTCSVCGETFEARRRDAKSAARRVARVLSASVMPSTLLEPARYPQSGRSVSA